MVFLPKTREKIISKSSKKADISSTTLIILAFCSVFYSRIVCTLAGLPSILNFAHFVTVTVALGVGLLTARAKDRRQIEVTQELLLGIAALLVIMLISALINGAGVVNVIFNFLILGEPFMFLLAIICIPLAPHNVYKIKNWILVSALINFLLAEIQYPLIDSGFLVPANGMNATDGTQGVFFASGAGGYVSAGVSIIVALYCFFYLKKIPVWLRIAGLVGAIHQTIIADTKQVILFCLIAWALLCLSNAADIKKLVTYLIIFTLAISAFVWAAYNLESFSVYADWFARDDIHQDVEQGGWAVKTEGIRMVIEHYQSPLNWLFGLGPGHTLGRLGGWSIMEYWHILSKFGTTAPFFYSDIWSFINNSWIALSTTLYVPLFSWAGIWGDLGWVGIGTYLYLGYIVWHRFCLDDFTKFLVLNVFVCGFVLTQMEEPGFMLFIAILIGLRWHEHRLPSRSINMDY